MPVDAELQAHLDREASSGLPPRSERSIALTRELYLKGCRALAQPVDLPRVDDLRVAGGIPVRLYAPSRERGLPGLIYLHGGRFISGNLETHDSLCREIARESGCAVIAVDYRLAPEHQFPAAVEDCEAAARWIVANAAPELRIDPQRLAVGGDSAGACLAAVTARVVPGLRAQWLIYPMLDPGCGLPSHEEFATGFGPGSGDMLRGWMEYLPPEIAPQDKRISALFSGGWVGLPRAYILTAECDCLRDEGELYVKRLRDAGTPVKLQRVPGAIHGFFQYTKFSELARSSVRAACGELHALLM